MASGFRRRRRGWEWWCDDHPHAGRYFQWRHPERRVRASLLSHLIREHPASEWVTPMDPS